MFDSPSNPPLDGSLRPGPPRRAVFFCPLGEAFAHTTFNMNASLWGTTVFVVRAYWDGPAQATTQTIVAPVGGGITENGEAKGKRYIATRDYEATRGSPIMRPPREGLRQSRRAR